MVLQLVNLNVALGASIVYSVVKVVHGVLAERRRHLETAVDQLCILNSHDLVHSDLKERPITTSLQERQVTRRKEKVGAVPGAKQRQHLVFVAKWARASKARFEFARECASTAINKAALHRWLCAQWKELGMDLLEISYYMDDAIELAFEPTLEKMLTESRKAVRARARMEYYNERKALEGIR